MMITGKGISPWAYLPPTVSIQVYHKSFPDLTVVSVLAVRAVSSELIGCGSLQSSLPYHLDKGEQRDQLDTQPVCTAHK